MKYFLGCLLILFANTLMSQPYDPQKVKSKAVGFYNKALIKLRDDQFVEAIPLLEKAIATDSNYLDAYLSLAGVYGELKQYQRSVSLYEKVQKRNPIYFSHYQLPYSINLAGLGRFDSAKNNVNTYLSIPNIDPITTRSALYRRDCYQFATNYQSAHPNSQYQFNPFNLGDSINTPFSEYLPTFSMDDSLMVFTRRNGNGEYFYQSHLRSAKFFERARLIPGDLNEEVFKGAISVSADGEWMVFAANIDGKTYGNYDLYICYATQTGWSEPQNLGENINSEAWESAPSLSPDKRALYFTSKREGGIGGADLYVSYRDLKGKWGEAINMGKEINSIGDEQAPFIHADNQTLYYTSNGLPGYGGSDLFVIRKHPSGGWSQPENLGYPINTIENEGSLAVAPNSIDAYYASDRSDSRGGLDLYHFELRKDVRPAKTIYLKGYVFDRVTQKGIPSNVELIDNSTGTPLMLVQTNETGYYFITLPVGKDFTFNVNRKGYLFHSKRYDLSTKEADSTYAQNIYLQPIALNNKMILKNILFELNDFHLKEISKIELNKLVQILVENPSLRIEIQGHTDNVGKPEENIKLSANRAKAVMDYLISNNISAARLQFKGLGATVPIAENTTEEGRAMNRRTEMVILGL